MFRFFLTLRFSAVPLLLATIASLMFAPARAADDTLEACAKIDSALERLDCYDRIAREADTAESIEAQPPEREVEPPSTAEPPAESAPINVPSTPEVVTKTKPDPDVQDDEEEFGITLFGKRRSDPDRGDSIESRIESVRETAAGNRVMTLANGQIWMEREAGRRGIDPAQNVVIMKRRWHYSMLLVDQNRRVTVQRID